MSSKKRQKTVAVDLDGVLATYDGWKGSVELIGDPIPGAREWMQELVKKCHVVIYTTRTNQQMHLKHTQTALTDIIANWLEQHSIPYDRIYAGEGKPTASAYIDDRAVLCRPQDEIERGEDPDIAFRFALQQIDFILTRDAERKAKRDEQRNQ